jgi:hypothetical protein
MKIRFFYLDIFSCKKIFHLASKNIFRASEILEEPISIKKPYSKYLLSTLESDFSKNMFGDYDKLLKEIDELKEGKKVSFIFECDGFTHYVSTHSVTFEHTVFGVCPHWPLWSCPLSHYKIAVQAARYFFAIPLSLNTDLIVELPESDMAQISLFPPKMADKEDALDIKND